MQPSSPILIGDIERQLWPNSYVAPFALSPEARLRHCYVVGQTGTGKSNLLEGMIRQDIEAGHGLALIDPHGTLAEAVLAHVPRHRHRHVIYLDPTDPSPVGLNLLASSSPETAPRIADMTVQSFVHIWGTAAVGPASEDVLRNALRCLMCTPNTTLLHVLRLIDDPAYRTRLAARVTDPVIARYWLVTVPNLVADRSWVEVSKPISNKLRAVLSDPTARNIVCQPTSSFDMRRLMDDGHILIANLRGRGVHKVSDGIAHLIGAILTSVITSTAFTRDPTANPRPFYFYAEEFASYANGAFAQVLSLSRKFGLSLTLAHQYLHQVPEELLAAVLGNAATTIAFRVGAEDAPLLARHLSLDEIYAQSEHKGHHQLSNLPNFQAFVRTLEADQPATYHLHPYEAQGAGDPRVEKILINNRARYGRPRAKVEQQIAGMYPT